MFRSMMIADLPIVTFDAWLLRLRLKLSGKELRLRDVISMPEYSSALKKYRSSSLVITKTVLGRF